MKSIEHGPGMALARSERKMNAPLSTRDEVHAAGVIAVDLVGDLTDASLDVVGWDEYVHS